MKSLVDKLIIVYFGYKCDLKTKDIIDKISGFRVKYISKGIIVK